MRLAVFHFGGAQNTSGGAPFGAKTGQGPQQGLSFHGNAQSRVHDVAACGLPLLLMLL